MGEAGVGWNPSFEPLIGKYHSKNYLYKNYSKMIKANKEVTAFIDKLPEDRSKVLQSIVKLIRKNISIGFEEGISNGMIAYYVPHSRYPDGYHCNPKEPLPFFWIAAAKSNITFYHMGVYASPTLLNWFTTAYAKVATAKLDMGKSCIRFKKASDIPVNLIGELAAKMSADEWIALYEKNYKKKK